MLPGALGQAVVAREGVGIGAHVGRPLDVVVAAEDVGAAAGHADIPQGELQDAEEPRVLGAHVVLGETHAPDDGAGPVFRHRLGDQLHLVLGDARDVFHHLRGPFRGLLADVIHCVHPRRDEVLILPAVLEDVPEETVEEGDVRPGTEPRVDVGMGGRAGEARVHDDHLRAHLLGTENVLHRDRVGLGRVAAQEEHGFAVLHVVEGIGHRPVAEGGRSAGDGRRMADPCLVVDIIRSPEGREFPLEVGPLVARLGRAAEEQRIRPRFLPDLHEFVADLVDGLVPGEALPGAVFELHRELHAPVAETVVPGRGALRAMGAQVNRRFIIRLLAGPDTVLDLGDDTASHCAVGADRSPIFGLRIRARKILLLFQRGLAYAGEGQEPQQGAASQHRAAPNEKSPSADARRKGGLGGDPC